MIMKTLTLVNLLFLFLVSCAPNKKSQQTPEKDIKEISIDSASNPKETKSTKIDAHIIFDLDSAISNPEKVKYLSIYPIYDKPYTSKYSDLQHLPSQIGKLINLKTLEIHCLEKLFDLPNEIGQLTNLEKIDIDNGNGCQMNISIPASIGQLQHLKELILYGALDPRDISSNDSFPPSEIKELPLEIGDLRNLEVLDLGRNGIQEIPTQIQYLVNLRILKLNYNDIHEIPSFISQLKNLKELHICENGKIKLPDELSEFNSLKLYLGNACLSLRDQAELKIRFPKVEFNFDNDYADSIANEEQ
jgi:Leucine-rich repeat (LRR) protein